MVNNHRLIGNLIFGMYKVAVLQRARSILRMILLAVGWLVEVAVLCRQYILKMVGNVSDWLFYAGGALIKVADSAGLTVCPAKVLHVFV